MTPHPNPKGYELAYSLIVDYILSFGARIGAEKDSKHCFGNPLFFNTKSDFSADDLVLISATPNSEYRLSWLKEQIVHPNGDREFLLHSAKTGNLCWWSNVGVAVMDRETVAGHPQWKWTNEQLEFNHKWSEVQKQQSEYIIRSYVADMTEELATIVSRTRFAIDDVHVSISVPWRVGDDELISYHIRLMKEHEDEQEKHRKQRNVKPEA